jgi:predicted short-subunit dehydrogenase-like oxidoreductase (DUF2520 family)
MLPARHAETSIDFRSAARQLPRPDRLPSGGGAGAAVIPAGVRRQPSRVWYLWAELEQAGGLIGFDVTALRFAVIGAGRLGASLALALRAQGLHLAGFTAHTQSGRARAEAWLGLPAHADGMDLVSLRPDLYIVAVPDAALPEVAARLAESLVGPGPAPAVVHTSGATSVDVLRPCQEAGATTLVFHPLQTFSDPVSGSTRFGGTAIAVTPDSGGADSPGARLGFALADLLGARPFLLADSMRSLYHAAATLACNYLVTLEHQAQQLFAQAGLPSADVLPLFLPLVKATLANIEGEGTVKALTGPLSRGDVFTVRGHLAALAADAPHLLPLYRVLGLATLDLVRARGEVGASIIDELAGLFRSS